MRIWRHSLAAALMLVFALPAAAQELPEVGLPDASTAPESFAPAAPLTTLEAISRGRALLKGEIERRASGGKRRVDAQPVWANVTLAIWQKTEDKVVLVDIRKSGRRIEVQTPGDWPLSIAYDNKIYSQYSLPSARNSVVIGVVYPVAKLVSGTTYELHDTLYVPFQDEFYRPEILAAGSDYLSDVIQGAFDELRAAGIKSRAYPDKLVVDVVDPYLLKSIIVIEHTSHLTLLRDNEPERALGVFLAKLAINGEDAFDVALSSAGASGLAQFIPSTYALFVKNRPQYGLIPDFRQGMADHRNAVKAEVAYIDDSLATLNGLVRETYAVDHMKAAEYLAAAYNGGSSRVNRSIAAYGTGWVQGLRPETKTYVAKLRSAYGMFMAGMFSTPSRPPGARPIIAAAAKPPTPPQGTICFDDGGCSI